MAYGFQFAKDRLSRALTETTQQRLQSICMPASPGQFIDRIDVVLDGASFHQVPGAGDALDVYMPVRVFVVPLQDVLDTPHDQNPASALTPSDTIVVKVRLRLQGARVASELLPPDLSQTQIPEPLKYPLATLLASELGPALNRVIFDGTSMLERYRLPSPIASRFAVTSAAVQVEYDPAGPVIDRAGSGQQWGVFLDARPAIDFALSRLPPVLRSGLISTTAEWAPQGQTPRVLARTELSVGVLVFKLPLELRMTMVPAPKPTLRVDFTWDVEVDAATVLGVPVSVLFKLAGIPGLDLLASEAFAEVLELGLDGVVALADDFLEEQLAAQGVHRSGDRSYFVDVPLPTLSLFEVALVPHSLLALGPGMTMGGPVHVQVVDRSRMIASEWKFGLPWYPTTCRKHGDKRPVVTKEQAAWLRYYAHTSFDYMGRFCSATLLEPSGSAAALIQPRLDQAGPTTSGFSFDISYEQAQGFEHEVRLVVRTSRGTRLVNLGKPALLQFDSQGLSTNLPRPIPDCLTYNPQDKRSAIMFGDRTVKLTRDDLVQPPEDPRWKDLVTSGFGLDVHVVSMRGLTPGEIVVFESDTHRVQVAADSGGRVTVPALAPRGFDMGNALLQRLSQQPIEGHVQVTSIAVESGAVFQAHRGPTMPFEPVDDRQRGLMRAMESFEIGPTQWVAVRSNPTQAWRPGTEVQLNPQPLPPGPPPDLGALNPQPLPPEPPPDEHPLVRAAGLKGVHAVFAVPGTQDDGLAIAQMDDGRRLVLERSSDGARVSGVFEGPIGRTLTRDGFTLAAGGGLLRLFEVQV